MASTPDAQLHLDAALVRARTRGTEIRSIIDVGASNGMWSAVALRHYPSARYHLLEARNIHEPALAEFARKNAGVTYTIAAAGPSVGTTHFHNSSDPYGGVASPTAFNTDDIVVPQTTIDAEVAKHNLPAPYLIKLDTHSFEIPILAGARETLRRTNLLIVEVYNIEWTKGCPLFFQMCGHLDTLGFRCVDVFDVMHRPGDQLLWQMDMAFAPKASPFFQKTSFT